MSNIIEFVGENVFESILEGFEVHEVVHLELKQPKQDLDEVQYGLESFLGLVRLNIWANWTSDNAVGGFNKLVLWFNNMIAFILLYLSILLDLNCLI